MPPTPDPAAPIPGLPDQALVVGDWTGEVAAKQEREALAYRETMRRLRRIHARAAERRQFWAEHSDPCAAARAVSYQTVVSDLNHLITDMEEVVRNGG